MALHVATVFSTSYVSLQVMNCCVVSGYIVHTHTAVSPHGFTQIQFLRLQAM